MKERKKEKGEHCALACAGKSTCMNISCERVDSIYKRVHRIPVRTCYYYYYYY